MRISVYPEDMKCLKLDLSVEASWTYSREGNESCSEKHFPDTDEVVTEFMFEF